MAHCATEQLAVLFPALDEHVHGFPYTGGNKRRANIVRKVAQPLRAIRLLVVVDLVGEIICAGSLFARVREHADVIEKTLFDEIAKLVEIFFRFPGKARDKRCAQRYLGDDAANTLHQRLVLLARTLAMHRLQDARLNMLKGDIEIGADVGMLGNGMQQFVGDPLGLDIHDAEPGIGEFVRKRSHKPRKA